jgi:hypothetical protein
LTGDKSILADKQKPGEEIVQADAFAKDILGFEEILDEEEGNEEEIVYENDEEGVPEDNEEEGEFHDSQIKGLSMEEK